MRTKTVIDEMMSNDYLCILRRTFPANFSPSKGMLDQVFQTEEKRPAIRLVEFLSDPTFLSRPDIFFVATLFG